MSISLDSPEFRQLGPRAQLAAWLATLTPEEREFASATKLDRYLPAQNYYSPTAGEEPRDALDDTAAEIIPEAIRRGTKNGRQAVIAIENPAINALEPQRLAVPVDKLSEDEIAAAVEDFGESLRWALSAGINGEHFLVSMGKRSAVMISAMREDMAGGLKVSRALAVSYLAALGDDGAERLIATGVIYGRVLDWMRRASNIAGLGERLQLVAYDLRPDLIDQGTLAKLGEELNKTRQAKSKTVNCLRDTFSGLRAITQRPDITRLRCKKAQTRG